MTEHKPKEKEDFGLYHFGIDMFEAAEEEDIEDIAKWADSHEGGLQAFVKLSQADMEKAVRKAHFILAHRNGDTTPSTLEVFTPEESKSIIDENPDELPIAARNLKGEIDEKSKSAIASVIASRKARKKK